MASYFPDKITELLPHLEAHKHSNLIARALGVLLRISEESIERLDWKILTATLEDLEKGFQGFDAYRHIRKISIFGSARIASSTPEYQMAVKFAECITQLGFMVITGAGGGIMQAGNEGAGRENSFGLNIQLPFEQSANSAIDGDEKLIDFKYFFVRKLFFLRESDAIALFPGGFGTQDEAFETLTLCQTGKYGPAPLVLIDKPGGDYWHNWNHYVCQHLVARGLVSEDDPSIYTITDNLDTACQAVCNFYRVYHSSRYVKDQFVIRLNCELTDAIVAKLNDEFSDILSKGIINKSKALPQEKGDETEDFPRLVFYFNQKSLGRLYQMIDTINHSSTMSKEQEHPEKK
ncbi:MAG: LOG family protein [Xenococcaceae cyanobacterium MO_167.B52]|nr:LOG family protein [Xenococcaceae cyanobacterium MO_167.B52]